MTRTIFRGANLLDGEHPAKADASVVVEGERIVRVASSEESVPVAEGDRVVELSGRTLMPGMVSAHYHSTYAANTLVPAPPGLEHPPGYLMLVAANNVRTALECGFTSIVSAGTIPDAIDAQLAQAIEDGIVSGPRIVPGSRGLDTRGGYSDTANWWWELGNLGAGLYCDGPGEFRSAVRQEIKRGARMIKLFASGGHGVPDTAEGSSISEDELAAVADAAHQRGAKVRAHCAWRNTILECIRAGIDVIDHGDEMDDECIEAMLHAGTSVVPSMFFIHHMLKDTSNILGATPGQMAPVRAEYENARKMIPRAHEAGVRMCVGDDYGLVVLQHGRYAEELEFYVKEVGIPALDVLRWATRNGAELMGRGDDLGTVAPGKLADLLVVDGDPSIDIGVLKQQENLHAILLGGRFAKDAL
jgi:imidazolonepropionase-like amidohydrolase